MVLTLGAIVACETPIAEVARDDRGVETSDPQPPPRPGFAQPAKVRYHMHEHVDDLRAIERSLIDGRLDDAKALALRLTPPELDRGMKPWARQSRAYVDAAHDLAAAPGIDEALRREVRVALACAECHLEAQSLPHFPPQPPLPVGQTLDSRMARHRWATDRLAEGMIGASEARWREGLDVLAATPAPYPRLTDAPGLATALQARARRALAAGPTETLDERAATYGELLVTCAACHATLAKAPSP